ncbi:hypothetical protein ZHAS_00014397 [Anopheles sinensis]|uniref:Uncharacterized protein n=1 Tax=Anopheles sinensis TaxID=74873 RepID=A0A084W856_ANOSI|nr:hypothetical protein ZHAS_00014397 [Anopheles sinensis]
MVKYEVFRPFSLTLRCRFICRLLALLQNFELLLVLTTFPRTDEELVSLSPRGCGPSNETIYGVRVRRVPQKL